MIRGGFNTVVFTKPVLRRKQIVNLRRYLGRLRIQCACHARFCLLDPSGMILTSFCKEQSFFSNSEAGGGRKKHELVNVDMTTSKACSRF